jgi:PTH1 family peptidyl-tRNA hydrolase
MKIIVGLGNPGEKYKNTRHNVGHMVVDELKTQNSKLKNTTASKTNTFMNESGEFVKKLVGAYRLSPNDLYVIHDDLDLPLGSCKIQFGKGPKDHNGLKSVDRALGTDEYWHVRVGIENRKKEGKVGGEDYVLQDFTKEERRILDKTIKETIKKLVSSQLSV